MGEHGDTLCRDSWGGVRQVRSRRHDGRHPTNGAVQVVQTDVDVAGGDLRVAVAGQFLQDAQANTGPPADRQI